MLDCFFDPSSVAIVGASHTPGKIGRIILENFLEGFKGRVYPINPDTRPILGIRVYASVKEVPEDIDLAVIATPAPTVPSILRECGEKGVRCIIIISAGFRELGDEVRVEGKLVGGKRLEDEIVRMAREHGIRVLGPNCLGVLDLRSGVNTIFNPRQKFVEGKAVSSLLWPQEPGEISILTQSGAFGITMLEYMVGEGLRLSKFVSYGNKADVDEVDLLEYLWKDEATRVIVIYMESIERGRDFIRVARRITKEKPIVVLKAGSTSAGSEAAISHTGRMAGSDEVYSAAFKQAGVLRAENLEELFDFVKALIYQPPAKGNRIGIVTCGGGAGVMTVDECVREGLLVPPLPSDLRQKLDELRERGEIPRVAVYRNVIDLSGSVTNGMYGKVLELLLGHPSYDGCIVIALHQPPGLTLGFVDEIAEVARKYEKPVVASSIGISEFAALVRKKLEERGIPVFPLYERAANAMQALVRYGAYLKEGFMP